jgi:hypothetical protein
MAVRAQAIIPALADRLGLRASAGEADRHAHAVGQGASSASNSGAMPCATALSQLSRVWWVIVLTPFKSPVRRWPCHRPEHGRPRTPAGEGAAGFDGGGAAAAQRGTAPSNPVAGEKAGTGFPHKADDAPANAGTLASEIRLRSRPRHVGRHLGPRPLAGLGSAASRATVPRSGRRKSQPPNAQGEGA